VGAELTVFSASSPTAPFSPKISKIDRLMPLVIETEQISNRRNSLLKQEMKFLTADSAATSRPVCAASLWVEGFIALSLSHAHRDHGCRWTFAEYVLMALPYVDIR
jgi:hypothetical protein